MTLKPGGPPTGLPDVVGLVHAVRQVGSPLNFFAVVLTVVLTFLVLAGMTFGLSESARGWLVFAGFFAAAAMTATVVWLTIKYPTFIFGERTQFLYQKMLYGTDKNPVPGQIVDALPAIAAEKLDKPQPALPTPTHEES